MKVSGFSGWMQEAELVELNVPLCAACADERDRQKRHAILIFLLEVAFLAILFGSSMGIRGMVGGAIVGALGGSLLLFFLQPRQPVKFGPDGPRFQNERYQRLFESLNESESTREGGVA
jgi:hypothetical protein